MKDKNHSLTTAQIYSTEFEALSEEIVKHFFEGTNAHIKKTDSCKDGGYDVVVEYSDGNTVRKIYFECKLRSDNLNLRDIAANLIIAFNEGAIALGIITNYDYTEQVNENISLFYDKTVLNIKIIIGEDIQKLADIYSLNISDGLHPIISTKKTKGKKKYQFLRIDYSKNRYYDQFLHKQKQKNRSSCSYIAQINSELFKLAQDCLITGKTIFVSGLLGVGKTTFIRSLLEELDVREVHVVADNYFSQPQLLLGIFLDVWGIPLHNIVRDFSDSTIDKIISTINKKSEEQRTGAIVKNLFGKTTPEGIADEHYNWLICNYLIHQLSIIRTNIKYIFYIENAERATEEVQILLSYICKLLVENHVGCVIEKNQSEYQLMEPETINIFYNNLKNTPHDQIVIPYLKKEQASEFIQKEMSEYPKHLQDLILHKGGVRMLTLNTLITFFREQVKQQGVGTKLLEKLQLFTPNDIPSSISWMLDVYFQKTPELFLYFSFFQGKVPFEWLDLIADEYVSVIDHLLELRFIYMDDDCLVAANELVMEKMDSFPLHNLYLTRRTAQKLLAFLNGTKNNCYVECKISAYQYLKQYENALVLLKCYMEKLWKERQYSSFLKYVEIALGMIKEHETIKRLNLLISGLKVWVIKKQANSSNAFILLKKFKTVLDTLSGETKIYYQIIYNYFDSKRLFKDCNFEQSLAVSKPCYDLYLQETPEQTKDEWKEKLCVVYALSVKELYGNEAAKACFDVLYRINKDSFNFQLEYLSHKQCMNFYSNPNIALQCVNEILEMFPNSNRDDYPLPYHEYVDRALCALCAKQYAEALEYSDEAIRILESNGIMPTLGRAYNIKGCIYLCLKNPEEAGRCIKEACFIMDEADYNLFSWRSRLNLIQLEVFHHIGVIPVQQIKEVFYYTYYQFKNIYLEKIKALSETESFYTTREYFALLMFGNISQIIKEDITSELAEEFLSEKCTFKFQRHLKQLKDKRIKNTEFTDCPYSVGKYLFMVG